MTDSIGNFVTFIGYVLVRVAIKPTSWYELALSCTWQRGKQEKVPGSKGTQQLTLEFNQVRPLGAAGSNDSQEKGKFLPFLDVISVEMIEWIKHRSAASRTRALRGRVSQLILLGSMTSTNMFASLMVLWSLTSTETVLAARSTPTDEQFRSLLPWARNTWYQGQQHSPSPQTALLSPSTFKKGQ